MIALPIPHFMAVGHLLAGDGKPNPGHIHIPILLATQQRGRSRMSVSSGLLVGSSSGKSQTMPGGAIAPLEQGVSHVWRGVEAGDSDVT
jgi:hypothetical protein